jgi:hypothetical protein
MIFPRRLERFFVCARPDFPLSLLTFVVKEWSFEGKVSSSLPLPARDDSGVRGRNEISPAKQTLSKLPSVAHNVGTLRFGVNQEGIWE